MDLNGKVIAVTGAYGNLGKAVALAASLRGARLALLDRAPAPLQPPPELSAALFLGGVDLTDSQAAIEAIDIAATRLGGLDALVSLAGSFRWETLQEGNADTWDFLYSINTRTAVIAAQAALPHLLARNGGRIVNVGANAAIKAGIGMGAYAAAKAGVARLTESLAEELKDRNITVNAVLPSIIDTPQNRADMPDADFSRWVSPAALAEVILFLVSDAASAITGALVPVTGRV